jgi:DNA-binding response OmpR family regulator
MTTLLLVDDEKNIIELERLYLKKEGYQIEGAYDSEAALEKFRATRPAAIILDLCCRGLTVGISAAASAGKVTCRSLC